jgi:hypothetical protein
MTCWAFLKNVEELNGELSPYERRHGKKFKGKKFPFGCGVWFLPSPTRQDSIQSKADPRLKSGIFMGYRTAPQNAWNGEYLVIDIGRFVDVPLHFTSRPTHFPHMRPHITKVVDIHGAGATTTETNGIRGKYQGVNFPLKERYEQYNSTLDGAEFDENRERKDEEIWKRLIDKGFLERKW